VQLLQHLRDQQPPDFNEYWQSHVLDDGELISFSPKAFSAHTIVHVYFSPVDFSSQCALSTDAAARLDADNDCAIDADKLGNSCNQAGFAPVLLS